MTTDFVTNEEIVREARKRLGQGPWDYLVGASESETTMRRNRLAFDRIAFRPRVLVDVFKTDTSTTFMGHDMRIPVLLAPVGSLQVFIPEGGAAAAKAAGQQVGHDGQSRAFVRTHGIHYRAWFFIEGIGIIGG